MQRHLLALTIFSLGTLASTTNCGGSVVATGGGSTTTSGPTTTTSSSSSTGGPGPTGCPATLPSGSCAGVTDGLECSYGDSVRPECRTTVSCDKGGWSTVDPTGPCSPPPSDCPATQPQNQVDLCTTMGDVCTYADTICVCDACALGPCMVPPVRWQCANVSGPPACPSVIPNAGTACGTDGLSCTYGLLCAGSGRSVKCTGGAWQWELLIICPG
jgi:hypothetical protein